MNKRLQVSIFSAPADDSLRCELVRHFAPLRRDGVVVWDPGQISPGADTEAEVRERITTSDIFLLLLTAGYLDDETCHVNGIQALKQQSRGARVVPVLGGPADWKASPFGKLTPLPRDEVPLSGRHDRESAIAEIVREVRATLDAERSPSTELASREPDPRRKRSTKRSGLRDSAIEGVQYSLTFAGPPAAAAASHAHDAHERARVAEQELERAKERRRRLVQERADTASVDAEILDLRSKRRGGQLRPGDRLAGNRFVLLERIGGGGFATVWKAKAKDEAHDELVAIKIMHPNVAANEEDRERFFRGAQRMAELSHPAIVPVILPRGEDDGFFFCVMKLMTGGDLNRAVLRGPLTDERVFEIILRVADALAAAHAQSWVHRDVKPANILLDESGTAFLSDFDLVAAKDTTGGTRTKMMGTFIYSAPETMEHPQSVDARADVFSLGMTLLFCLHRSPLGHSVIKTPDRFIRRLECSEAVKAVIRRAIRWQQPKDRFEDARAFGSELRRALEDQTGYELVAMVGEPPARRESKPLMEMIVIPGGTFKVADEKTVTLTPYFFSKVPVSEKVYRKVMDQAAVRKDKDNPTLVTWYDAVRFCNRLSELEGLEPAYEFVDDAEVAWHGNADGYRLPTDAEWEFAACGTDGRTYPWGNEPPSNQLAWSGGNNGRQAASPVGSYPEGASPFGVLDMAGNSAEWCWDWHNSYWSNQAISINPSGSPRGSKRVIRGSDWRAFQATWVRATHRLGEWPSSQSAGIRVARGPRDSSRH